MSAIRLLGQGVVFLILYAVIYDLVEYWRSRPPGGKGW